ncbi:MAG: hypothetical protein QM778_26185 [Myxococcales bacterium]
MASIAPDLLALLADPETHEAFALASSAELAALKQAVSEGRGRRRNGSALSAELDGALLCQGRRVAYLIEAGIPNLLIDERVELDAPL